MARYRFAFDEAKIARRIKEGRGQGRQADYKPWLTVHDLSSSGLSVRMVGRKSGRLHHLLSGNLEQAAFLEFDWSDAVAEIREQFPLDRDETREIAAEMGISHPRDPKTQVDMVMTTDFVLDIHSQEGTYLLAWAIKPAEELRSRRTIDKLEIERRYWERRKVGWRLSSEPELPFQRAQNLRFLNGQRSLDDVEVAYTGLWKDRCDQFLAMARADPQGRIGEVRRKLTETHGFGDEDFMTVVRHLLANKKMSMDVDVAPDFNGSLAQFDLGGGA